MSLAVSSAARGGEWDGVAFPQAVAPPPAAAVASAADGPGAVAATVPASAMRAWLVLPTRMVFDDADLPAEVAAPAAVELRAARNENECIQLVLMRAAAAEHVTAEFTDFTADGDSKLPPTVWKLNKVAQVPGRPALRAAPVLRTWQTVGDGPDTYTSSTARTTPDPLLPVAANDLKLDAGLTRLWLTVHVPKDARPGVYRGKVRLLSESHLLLDVPLAVRVWNQVMPDDSSLIVLANVWPHPPTGAAGEAVKGKPLWDQLRPIYDDLKAHRINATGEIYPLPAWRQDAPPPDTHEYEKALHYVLDDLGFVRFRFPGLASAARGTWQGINVFEPGPAQLAESRWISGAAFTASFPPAPPAPANGDEPFPHWARVAGRAPAKTADFGGATLAGYSDNGPDAWVEYAFETTSEQPLYVFLQVDSVQPQEKKQLRIDGRDVGTLEGEDFLRSDLGFARLKQPVRLKPGKHALRVSVADAVDIPDPIYGILLSPYATPDLDQILRDRAKLSTAFKGAMGFHVQQMSDWLRKHQWLKKAQARLKDVPAVAEYGRVAAVYDYIGEVMPSVRRELPEQPVSPLRPSVEVWTPSLSAPRFDPDRWQAELKPTDELWAYHNYLHTLGYPSISMRILPWLIGRHGFKGYVFWSVNYWPSDPFTETNQQNVLMRGTMLYPNPDGGPPIDSVRWDLFREGLEDFETLRMLRAAMDAADADPKMLSPEQRAALASAHQVFDEKLPAVVRSARDFSWDPAALEAVRTQAGEALSGLTPP